MPEGLLDDITAERCDAEAWEVAIQHPLDKWHRSLGGGRERSAPKKKPATVNDFLEKKRLKYRFVYNKGTGSLRLEAPNGRTKDAAPDLEAEFSRLAQQWRHETRMLSSDADIAANFAYYQIIGMGEKAVPLILRELQEHGGRWFWALRAITRQNPVAPKDRGNTKRMIQAWLEWGKQNGYV